MPTMTADPPLDLAAMRAAILAAAAGDSRQTADDPQPTSAPDTDDDERQTFHIPRAGEAAAPVTEAIVTALVKLYPGNSKTAIERRKKVFTAIAAELSELYVYGVDLDGRVPIGEPIVLGNAHIEVDGFGDAVRITCDGGTPIWGPW